MKGEQISIANDHTAAANAPVSDDVLCTDLIRNGRRAYMRNKSNPDGPNLPRSYDVLLCEDPTSNIEEVIGYEAIVCLVDGRLLFREVQPASKSGLYDLHDPFNEPTTVTRNVQIRWAAALACAIPDKHWNGMLAEGKVQKLADSLHSPGGAGRALRGMSSARLPFGFVPPKP